VLQTSNRYYLYTKLSGVLLHVDGIQFILEIITEESHYHGDTASNNTLSDTSDSCPSIDAENPLQCVNSIILLQPSAIIFSSIVFIMELAAAGSGYFIYKTLDGRIALSGHLIAASSLVVTSSLRKGE
jgi:hypothetical protein